MARIQGNGKEIQVMKNKGAYVRKIFKEVYVKKPEDFDNATIESENGELDFYHMVLPNNQTIRKLFQNKYESTFGE